MQEKQLNTIWRVPRYIPFIQPILSEEDVVNAEKKIGYKLPLELVNILKIQNGGYIRFTIKNIPHCQIFGIGPNEPSLINNGWSVCEIVGLIPFDGDGHWCLCLDYRENKIEPKITYIDIENNTEKIIAENFNDYLLLLEIETKDIYVIATDLAITEVIQDISRIMQIDFELPDSFAHGHPIFRSKYKNSWVWLSLNKVPRSFIRSNDVGNIELKSNEDMALRYPEIPEKSVLIRMSGVNERDIILAKLKENSFKVHSLNEYIERF